MFLFLDKARRLLPVLMFLLIGLPAGVSATDQIEELRKSVVRVNVVAQYSDYRIPWNPGRMVPATGTGFLLPGNRILTNAHVSGNASFITVEKEGDSRKYEAKLQFVAHDCDLAILQVSDPDFFQEMLPLSLGGIPSLNSSVIALGHPIGGDRLSVTRGVVSRVDFQVYSHSSADSHLAIQIDAAINPGNSGGPVLQDGKVVGVAFQGYSGDVAQNVGYMIPVPVISRFLKDVEDGRYDQYVDLGIYLFSLINDAHRRALGLGSEDFGALVSYVISAGAAADHLKVGDVLLSIDDVPIYSDGSVEMDGERVFMAEVVERKFKGDSVRLKILRDKKESMVTISLTTPWPYLMHSIRHGVRPRFVVFGGLVFQPLSLNFLRSVQSRNVDLRYHYLAYMEKELYKEKPDIVVLSKILPDPVNAFLKDFTDCIIEEINGRKIRFLEDVSAAFKKDTEYYVIRLLGKGRPVVLEKSAVAEARQRILKRYGVQEEEYLEDALVPARVRNQMLQEN